MTLTLGWHVGATTLVIECSTVQITRSFDEFREDVFDAMETKTQLVHANVRIYNLEIQISDDLARATNKELVKGASNPRVTPSRPHNFRFLERGNGDGKVFVHGCWANLLRDSKDPALEVAVDRQILWMNNAAEMELKSSATLQSATKNSRLRSRSGTQKSKTPSLALTN